VRALIKLRCGNLKKVNKYWLDKGQRSCVFREEGKDSIGHCNKVKAWFREMSNKGENIVDQLRKKI